VRFSKRRVEKVPIITFYCRNPEISDCNQSEGSSRQVGLQNVLEFIAEQQQYCHSREQEDTSCQRTSPDIKDCITNEKDWKPGVEKMQRTENFSKCLDNDEDGRKPASDMVESAASSLSTPDTVASARLKLDTPSKLFLDNEH